MAAAAKIRVPKTGQTIGAKYRLLRRIGAGGMGDVYEAVHVFTERLVAVKVMHPMLIASSPEIAERVFREAAVAATVDHPGIVSVLDAGEDADCGALYIVFELLEGEDLETAMERDLRPHDLIVIAVQVLEALAAVHAAGIVHRDVKPSNVFLARTARGSWAVKLLDFGIALEVDDGERLEADRGTVVGTVEYMSPEQALGDPIDRRTDLYALGALLFRGLTGSLPFTAPDYSKLLIRVATEDAPPIASLRPDLPPELAAIIDCALKRDRTQRFESAQAMALALRKLDLSKLSSLPPPGASDWSLRALRTSRTATQTQAECPVPSMCA
jgi:eukaryotic-like serine/threonine-protein kinase